MQAAWDSGNEDSEGEYASLSSTSCHDPEPIFLKPTAKRKTVRLKPTSKARAVQLKAAERNLIRLQSVERNPIRLQSVKRHPIRLRSVVRPTSKKTKIEHRLSDTGRWLPVLSAENRATSEVSKTKVKPSQAPEIAFDPGIQNQYQWKPSKEESCSSGLTRAYWRKKASESGSAGSKD